MQCKGYAASGPRKPLEPFAFERRQLGPSDVLVDIKYCGVCHSDIHHARDEWGRNIFPMVPGHEIAGIVSRVGEKVTKFKIGDRAGIGCFINSCRSCSACKAGFQQFCQEGMTMTYNGVLKDNTVTYGGYSQFITVDENYVLRMPSNISLESAAPLLCAGITTYSPLRHWGAGPGKKVAVLGLGGLGHVAVKLAKAMGAEVHVISQSDKKKEDALRFGAHYYHNTSIPDTLKNLIGTFDLLLNTVSAQLDWNAYVNTLAWNGVMVLLGIPDGGVDMTVKIPSLIFKRRSVAGSIIGGIAETQEMLDFCSQHNIGCDVEVIPISQVNEAYDRVVKSDVKFRFVIDLKSLPLEPAALC